MIVTDTERCVYPIPRRLLYVVTTLGWGGAESQVIDLARSFKALGWDVAVAVLLATAARRDALESVGIPVYTLGMTRGRPDLRAVWRLAELIRRMKPTVVHAHMVHANLLSRVTRSIASAPVLISSAHSISEGGRWREIAYRMTDRLADLTTNVSNAGVERFEAVGAAPHGRIRFMPNGIDVRRFRSDSVERSRHRVELGLGDRFVWLAVGRFEEAKDYPNMLDAFATIRDHAVRPLLLIAGDGPLREQLEARVADLGLQGCVRFLGLRRDIPGLMNAADAYVLSSAWEGLPIVLLEAAASALPIVTTDVGGTAQIVRSNETGILVRPRDSRQLAGAMAQMMVLPEATRAAWGRAGMEYTRAVFGLESVVEQWELLYRQLYFASVKH